MGRDEDARMERLRADLLRWAAASRAEEAARSRAREAWLRHQAAEETSWSGLALGWAERGRRLAVATSSGRALEGLLLAVGTDFLVLLGPPEEERSTACPVLVAASAMCWVRPSPDGTDPAGTGEAEETAPGDDGWDLDGGWGLSLAGALSELAGDRARVEVVAGRAPAVRGELRWVGTDVICLEPDAEPYERVYVLLGSISEVAVLGGAGQAGQAGQAGGSTLGSG